MALHEKDKIRAGLNDDVYAASDLSVVMPKYKMPEKEHDPRHAYQVVHDELMLDGNARQNLATFCQTWLDPEIHKLMDECIDKNMIDKDEYPQSAEIENRCVHMLADLWNSPDAANTLGCSTTGSSEAAMLGGMAMKWRWREKMKAAGKPTDKPNMVCGPVQVCWHKFARYWDVELREIPMEGDRLIMTPEEAVKRCDENTIGVVPTLGVTFTCQYEPVKAVSDALDQFQKDTGLDIPIHVDGASGGFLAPFVDPDLEWDFRLPRVKSINTSGHKFGLVYPGIGWVIFREKSIFNEDLIFYVNYLGGESATATLNFSRNAVQIIAQCYKFLRHGKEGYADIMRQTVENAERLRDKLVDSGYFTIMNETQRIPVVALTLKDDHENFNEFDVSFKVREKGWVLSAYTMPPNAESVNSLRIVVRPHLNRTVCDQLARDIVAACDYLKDHGGTARPPELHAHAVSSPAKC